MLSIGKILTWRSSEWNENRSNVNLSSTPSMASHQIPSLIADCPSEPPINFRLKIHSLDGVRGNRSIVWKFSISPLVLWGWLQCGVGSVASYDVAPYLPCPQNWCDNPTHRRNDIIRLCKAKAFRGRMNNEWSRLSLLIHLREIN